VKTISGAPLQTSQGPGPITAFTGAPNNAVLYIAAGLVTTSTRLSFNPATNVFAVGDSTLAGSPYVSINALAGNTRSMRFLSAGVVRWIIQASNGAEAGADAGTDLQILARSDGGAVIDTPFSIVRAAAGLITIGGALNNRPITLTPPNQGLRINNQVTGAGVGAGTLLNAPAAGNPAFWCPISIAGVVRFFPCW
jgi:hypothetical protein